MIVRTLAIWLLLSLSAAAADVESLLNEGDRFFARRADASAVGQAKGRFLAAARAVPPAPGAYWRLAQVLYWQAHRLPKDRADRRQLAEQGRDWAEKALTLDKRSTAANFWYAMNLMLLGESLGIPKAVTMVGQVRQALQQAALSEPSYWGGGPDRMLGRIDLRAPWPIGNKQRALSYIQKAMRLAPRHPQNRLYLAEAQVALGEPGKARQTLNELLALSPDPAFSAEAAEARSEAQALLKRL